MSVRCGHCSTKGNPVSHDTVAQVRLCAERSKRASQERVVQADEVPAMAQAIETVAAVCGGVVVEERSNPVVTQEVTPARWNNTGGDCTVHLVPAGTPVMVDPTQEEVWAGSRFQVTTPLCGLGKYHGGWTYIPKVVPPLHLCRFCFPEGVL